MARRTIEDRRPASIHSHIRSGTVAITAFIARNLFGTRYDRKNRGAGKTGHWTQRRIVSARRATFTTGSLLFGDHYAVDYRLRQGDRMDDSRQGGACCVRTNAAKVYIVRDGRDVACSLWRTPSLYSKELAGCSLTEFLAKPIDFAGSPGRRLRIRTRVDGIAKHWAAHVNGWLGCSNTLFVRYEEFVRNPLLLLWRVASFLDVPMPDGVWLPPVGVGIAPHEGGIGSHKKLMSPADIERFMSMVDGPCLEFLEA